MSQNHFQQYSRRDFLQRAGAGFGGLALGNLLAVDQLKPKPGLNGGVHHPAKVKRVIQLFMTGGVSPMDTFDYKPMLAKLHGQKLGPKNKPEGFVAPVGAIMKSPFEFKQYGDSGQWVSSVFPHQSKIVDELTFLNAMSSKTNVHGPGTLMMNTGFLLTGFPCMGSWMSYGLGSLSDNLPTFVVLPDPKGLPYNAKEAFSSGFLPAQHQGTMINVTGKGEAIPNLFPDKRHPFAGGAADDDGLRLLAEINRHHAESDSSNSLLESRIKSYELAAKMQLAAPEAFDLSRETKATRQAYGLDQRVTEDYARRCILARRLIERGTRFVQVWSGPDGPVNNWDNHNNIQKELPPMAASVDQPIAALVRDLKQRGLFDDTLLIWTTEFGRTPFAQGSLGRDHNGGTFVTWMAGAGLKPGMSYGQSDDWGYKTAEGKTYCYDLHATILHLMGIDHEKLSVRQNGIDRRLTDVHGHVIGDILA